MLITVSEDSKTIKSLGFVVESSIIMEYNTLVVMITVVWQSC